MRSGQLAGCAMLLCMKYEGKARTHEANSRGGGERSTSNQELGHQAGRLVAAEQRRHGVEGTGYLGRCDFFLSFV